MQAAKPTPRIHYSKHLPGVSGVVGVGTSASTLADPVGSRQQCGWSSLQTRAPQTLHLESAPPPPRSPNCTPSCAWSAHSLRPNARPVLPPTAVVLRLGEVPNSTGTLSTALLDLPTLFRVRGGEGGEGRREETGSCGSRSLDKVACWTPGGGGGGGRGKTMPRLRRGRRRLQARRAGRLGAGKLPGGAHRSEALASASRSSDTARDIAGLQQPPPPPGGPSKSLDLGEGIALSGITSRAGERPGKP